jgi:hypothetical protein
MHEYQLKFNNLTKKLAEIFNNPTYPTIINSK